MIFRQIKTRSIVILGYCVLVTLAITGFVTIYIEVVKSNRQGIENSILKQELIDLNNTLTTMYHAEETANLLAYADNDLLKHEYDSLSRRVLEQIEALRVISPDTKVGLSLDSLSELLQKKRSNTMEMFQLIRQIDKNIVNEITKTTIITRNDVDKLSDILVNMTQVIEDTIRVVAERRNFLQRVRDVVRPNSDTITQISTNTVYRNSEAVFPLLVDTIIGFFRQIDKQAQQKNAKIVQKLIAHQHELYIIKEQTGLFINTIMDNLMEREYQTNLNLLNEKNLSMKRSGSIVAIIGLSASIVAVFFMSWTVQSLNKAQKLQRNIQEAKNYAEKLLISREQLIYTITHDIKVPISSITGFLDLLSEEALSQKQKYYVSNMYSSSTHILDLVRNLLDFHSIEKEKPKLTNITFSPASLIQNIYESFLPLAQKKKMTFELKSNVSETSVFFSDPYYIRQIVNNLLSNAIKYTPEFGQVYLIASTDKENCWTISIQDNGPGIDAADQVKIFDEFVRLNNSDKKLEGTGLGLTISQKLSSLLGGTIEIESTKGAGSTFTLTVPLIAVPEEAIPEPDKSSDYSSARILFVDDDRVQLNLFSELMKSEDWPCICCTCANEALEILQKQSFDIIFTDIRLPDIEGYELIKQIRKSDYPHAIEIPVIAFSADCQKSKSELEADGFNGFLLKPFKSRQLLEIIEKHTSLKRKSNKIYQEKKPSGWGKIMDFVNDDQEAAQKIIESFMEEVNKDRELLTEALQKKDREAVKQISHKMLTLMKMVSAQEIVSILTDFEKGVISKEKKTTLFRLLDEMLKDAEITLHADVL